jgi:peptidoglycan-N-acetylglucosamine deacetylase
MTLGKKGTWAACTFVGFLIVAAGVALDRALGTRLAFTLAALVVATVYLEWSFGLALPLLRTRVDRIRQPGSFSLTFDDGPDPRNTAEISELLALRDHRATFFVLGAAARRHPELVAKVHDDGHEIAVHGYDHRLLAFSLPSVVRRQVEETEAAVLAATGRPPVRLFRAPHGVRSPWLATTLKRRGYRLCGWDGRIFDTANPGIPTIVARVRHMLAAGAVILLHDGDGSGKGASRRQTVDALPAILDDAEARGLRSIRLSALLSTGEGSSVPPREPPRGRRRSASERETPA